jgi:hypothetical protein
VTKRRNIRQNVNARIEANRKRAEAAREDELPIKIIMRTQTGEQSRIQTGPRVTLTLRVDG